MPRRTFPRSDQHHRVVATEVLDRHVRRTCVPLALPVPIESIIEDTYGLSILFDVLDEPPETMILGALFPGDKRIVLNERHLGLFETLDRTGTVHAGPRTGPLGL
jgi:hypothetical protein